MTENIAEPSRYTLATGRAGSARLRLLDELYGPATYALIKSIGLSGARQIADIGCGVGSMSVWLGERFPQAQVIGADASPEQIAVATQRALDRTLTNIRFDVADAYVTGLPTGAFDLVYCRAILCHLREPLRALAEMRRLVKPGGILLCEDFDNLGSVAEPSQEAYRDVVSFDQRVSQALGLDFNIGLKLPAMLAQVCIASPQVQFFQPVFLAGEGKRLIELSLAEQIPYLAHAGVATWEEMENLVQALRKINEDDQVLVGQWRMTQAWGYG